MTAVLDARPATEKTARTQTKEIRSLTGLRGVAALYVMIFHFFGPYSKPSTTFLEHGYLAVDLFFVLSGFVMALNYGHLFHGSWSPRAYTKFLGRRIARVYPLYFVATVGAAALASAGWLATAPITSMGSTLIANLLLIQSWGLAPSLDGPAWSISAEWAAYLLFPLLLVPCLYRSRRAVGAAALVSVGIVALLTLLPQPWGSHLANEPLNIYEPRGALTVVRCLPEFALGLITFRVALTPFGAAFARSRWIAGALCLATLLLLAIPKSDLAVVLLFPLVVLALRSEQHLPGRILSSAPAEFLGLLSYSIYLTHHLLTGVIDSIHLGVRHSHTYASAIAIILTFIFAYLAYRFIEVPGRRWLRRLFEGARPRTAIIAEPSAP